MIGKPITGRSFGGCVRYLVNKPEATILDGEGVRIQSANTITRDFNLQRKLNPELGKAVGHTILSWSKEDLDKLDDQIMIEVAKSYLKKMGITNTQFLIVKHTDRLHPHLHIVYNRVDNSGKTITDNNNYRRNVKVCRELTEGNNFYLAPGKEQVNRQRLKGKDMVRYAIHDAVKEALKTAGNWRQLEDELRRKGVEILYKYRSGTNDVQGISFRKDGLTFKGSTIDRALSFTHLGGRLGTELQRNKEENLEQDSFYSKEKKDEKEGGLTSIRQQNNYNIAASSMENLLDILSLDEHMDNGYNPFEQETKRKKRKKKQTPNL